MPCNLDLVDQYCNYLLVNKNYSSNTVFAYRSDILLFEESLKVKFELVTSIDVGNFLKYLNDNYAPTTRARKFSSLKNFYKFLIRSKIIEHSVFDEFKLKTVDQKVVKFLTVDEINRLLDFKCNSRFYERDQAMFEVLYATGIRVSELLNIRFKDINLTQATINIIAKGNKQRIVILNDSALRCLTNLVSNVTSNQEFVFVNNRSKKLSRQGFYKILKIRGLKVNILDISPHMLRHSIASHMINQGASLRFIQEMLGHSDINTTQMYTHISKEAIKKEYNLHHPLGDDNKE